MTTRQDIIDERNALKAQYGGFYDELAALLFRHDPVGLDYETNRDEYDPEARAILKQLPACASTADVARLAHEVFVRFFDARTAGPPSRYEPIADEIWRIWSARQQS